MNIIDAGACGLGSLVVSGVKNPLHLTFPNRLTRLLNRADKPQNYVAALAGISEGLVSKYEAAKTIPRVDSVERIANSFGVQPCWLAFGPEGTLRFRKRRDPDTIDQATPELLLVDAVDTALRSDEIPSRLKAIREVKALSLRRVAEAAAMSPQGILKIENGLAAPLISTIEALAVALDVSPGWLAFGIGEGPSAD